MKKTAALAALAALLLAGCSSSSTDAVGSVNDALQTQDYVAPVQTADEKYLADVHAANNAYLEDESDATLLDVGHETCRVLNSGYSIPELVSALLSDTPSNDQIEYEAIIIGNAIEHFCPEHLDELNG